MRTLERLAVRRRTLIAALPVSLAALGFGRANGTSTTRAKPTEGREPLALLDTHVAGAAYYRARAALGRIETGERLVLRREPANRHDAFAIEILTANAIKLGYVPRHANIPFARLMDAGRTVTATVLDVADNRHGDPSIRVRLDLLD